MIVTIKFGYKNRRFFTTDCLTAYMMDCVWKKCKYDMITDLNEKDAMWKSEVEKNSKKQEPLERKIKELER